MLRGCHPRAHWCVFRAGIWHWGKEMTRGAVVGNPVPSVPAGLFRTRLIIAVGWALCRGWTPLPLPLPPGKMEMLIPSVQRCKPPAPVAVGEGTARSAGLGAAGSWASLPTETARADPSVFTLGRGSRGITPRGLCPQIPFPSSLPFFHALLATGEVWCLC